MRTVKISICIPVTKIRFLYQAIESAYNQKGCDFEIIVSENEADGDVASIISRFPQGSIRHIRSTGKLSAVENWNRAIGLASGEWVICLCDDDILSDSTCATVLERSRDSDLDVWHSRVGIINESGELISLGPSAADSETVLDFAYTRFKYGRPQFLSDFAYRRSALAQVGGFVKMPGGWFSDDATAIAVGALKGKIGHINQIGLLYRSYAGTTSSTARLHDIFNACRQFSDWVEANVISHSSREVFNDVQSPHLLREALNAYTNRVVLQAIAKTPISQSCYWWMRYGRRTVRFEGLFRGILRRGSQHLRKNVGK
jgi:glycosyltransferase involved in cell wall biosynthesis